MGQWIHELDYISKSRVIKTLITENYTTKTGCIELTRKRQKTGYIKLTAPSREGTIVSGAHRLTWLALKGRIPEGLVVNHLCHSRACVNTDHLELITHKENVSREKRSPRRGCKTHGHSDGYYLPMRGSYEAWICRPCRLERKREWRERKKLEKAMLK